MWHFDTFQELEGLPLVDPSLWSTLPLWNAGRSAVTPGYHPHLGALAHPSVTLDCVRVGCAVQSGKVGNAHHSALAP